MSACHADRTHRPDGAVRAGPQWLRRVATPARADEAEAVQATLLQAAPLALAQRTLGNRGMQRALAVGAPDDEYEREAEQVADQVMQRAADAGARRPGGPGAVAARAVPLGRLHRAVGNRAVSRLWGASGAARMSPAAAGVQRRCSCGGGSSEREDSQAAAGAALQRRAAGGGASPAGAGPEQQDAERQQAGQPLAVRRQTDDLQTDEPGMAPPIVERVLATPGQPLAEVARRALEPGFGHDFGRVRVHDDTQAAQSAQAVAARAYTVGEHIVFGAGQYRPDSAEGQRLLAHELTHTIQQTGGAPLGVQRYSWDEFVDDAGEVAESAAEGVEQAADAVASGAQAAGEAVASGAEAVGEAVVSGAEAVGEAAVSGAEAVGEAAVAGAQAVGEGAAAVAGAVSDAADWALTEAGQAALAAAKGLAGLAGGSVTVGPAGLVIDLPEIDLFDSYKVPILPPTPRGYVPLLAAGTALGPVILVGSVGIPLGAPVLSAYLGPGRLQAIRIRIDPISGVYSASGQLYVGAALNAYLQTGAALRVDAITAIPTEPPIPVDAALEGGLLLTLQGSVPGSIAQTVTLSYSGGAIGLDLDTTLQLGAILEANLDAYLNAQLYGVELCEFIWPIQHWQESEAGTLSLPVSLRYGGGGPPVTVGPVTTAPMPVERIETALQRFVPQTRCKSIEEVADELCKQKKLPPEVCEILKPGQIGPPGVGPLPVVPPGGPGGSPPTPSIPPTPGTQTVPKCAKTALATPRKTIKITKGKFAGHEITYQDKRNKHTKVADCPVAQLQEAVRVGSAPLDGELKKFVQACEKGDLSYGSQLGKEGFDRYEALMKTALEESSPDTGFLTDAGSDIGLVGGRKGGCDARKHYRVHDDPPDDTRSEFHLFPVKP